VTPGRDSRAEAAIGQASDSDEPDRRYRRQASDLYQHRRPSGREAGIRAGMADTDLDRGRPLGIA
jgi:hypothetical protein